MPQEGLRIIDSHVHLYPAEVSADPAGFAARMGETRWGAMVAPHPDRKVRQGWADCDRLLADMDAAGVERAVLLGWYWERLQTCTWQNRYYAACVRAHPDRLTGFAAIHVSAGSEQASLDEMARARDDGLIGLGEVCPWAVGGAPGDEAWRCIFARAAEWGWPVNLHVTDPASRPIPGRVLTPLEDVVALAGAFPHLRLILAHWGGGLALHEVNAYARRTLAHVVYDTAASPLLYDPRIFRLAVETVGADRILFGSDYPLMAFPKEQAEPDFARMIRHVAEAGLAPDQTARLFAGNAGRLLGL